MCVAGGVFIVTPKKLEPAAWQLEHPEVMPAWFMLAPAKLAKFAAAWQISHGAPVGTWFAGGVFIVTPKNARPAAWHVAQLAVTPAWFMVVPAKLVKLPAAWQVSHGIGVGKWVAGGVFGTMLAKLAPGAWQVAHPLLIPAWFIVPTL
jgi:hypothetical protein